MRFVFLAFFSVCACSLSFGQGTISGKVFDEDLKEIVSMPVYLFSQGDSSNVQKVFTDEEGRYCFRNVPKGRFFIKASWFGCSSPKKKIIMFDGSHITADINIYRSIQLPEVVALSNSITFNGDTTTYRVSRFVSGKESNLKEILDRLPNICVDESTKSITANGRHINRVLLEGCDLFQGNTSIPLDNLTAEGVKKIEIIDNYSEYNIYEGFKTTNETVLNIGMDEKSRNDIKGEIESSGGLMNKYSIRNSVLYIGKKTMYSGIFASNNTGSRLLMFQDLIRNSGGLGNLLVGDNPMGELTKTVETYSVFTSSRKDIAKRGNGMVTLNVSTIPNRNVKLYFGGIYGYDHYRSSRTNSYSYLSGLQYSEESNENSHQHNGLLNFKLSYMPNNSLNFEYSANVIVAKQDKWSDNVMMDINDIAYSTTPMTLHVENSMTLAKRFVNNIFNISIRHSERQDKELAAFESTHSYFPISFGLDNSYESEYMNRDREYSVQISYLHKISQNYFLRLTVNGEEDKQYFTTRLAQSGFADAYDNDLHINYVTCYGDVMLGKDSGKLGFSLKMRYLLYNAHTNIKRSFRQTNASSLSPLLEVKYKFTPFHHLMVKYEYSMKKNAIGNLIDGQWVKSYNKVVYSCVDRLYSPFHILSLSHLLSLQYIGLNIMNIASFEEVKAPVIDNFSQEGYISKIMKMQGSREKSLSLMSMVEYKFINFPLNVRCKINYNHTYTPLCYNETLYDAKSNILMLMFQLITFNKKGFNGELKWQYYNQGCAGIPIKNRLNTNDITGKVSWQNKKIYACIDAGLKTYDMCHTFSRNMYYGFEIRYDLTEKVAVKLNGVDVTHLKENKQMMGKNTSYCTTNTLTSNMPGHIMAGISIKY